MVKSAELISKPAITVCQSYSAIESEQIGCNPLDDPDAKSLNFLHFYLREHALSGRSGEICLDTTFCGGDLFVRRSSQDSSDHI